jgi:aminoglycoside phosphotransferase family enzyme/predicted kinase
MITEDQSGVIAFLSSPDAHAGATVERIDTHASVVFLAGERAWKLKRAVRYDYLDYSTADRRRAMCEAELRINRRTASNLYLGVRAITRQTDGSVSLGGDGHPVDWLVEMVRFDQHHLFDRLAEAGVLALKLMNPLAQTIARFHARAERCTTCGGWEAMRRIIDGNAAGFTDEAAGILDQPPCRNLTDRARFALDRVGNLLDQRRDNGFVRHCHGDLHLRNILLWEGRPTLFDAIEFNDDIASIDVLYDLAFLLMDLWRLDLPHHANVVWNGYLAETMDLDGLPLMPLFMSCRAAVMAKTTATSARLERDQSRRRALETTANDYLAFAIRLLDPPPPSLVAVGGFSGTGKSTLAMRLAPSLGAPPGAVVLRSDAIRKRLRKVKPTERLGPEGYTDEVSRQVYASLLGQADTVVRGGFTALADAVFAKPADRDAIEHVASAAGVPFTGVWLEAPPSVLIERVAGRRGDVSDASVEVLQRQRASPLGVLRWHHLDASGTRQQVCDRAAAILCPARAAGDPALEETQP